MEELLTDVARRLEAIGEQVSEQRLRSLVTEQLQGLLGNEEFSRKMRFGQQGDARLTGSKFGRWRLSVADIEFLYDVMNAMRSVGGKGPSEELENAFKAISAAVYIPEEQIRQIDRQALDNLFPRVPLRWYPAEDRELAKRGAWEQTGAYQRAMRAMDTAESGYGNQLIGAQYVGDLWEGARLESRILALLPEFEMTAPVAYVPVEADIPEMLFVGESTAYNSANYTTSKSGSNRATVTAKKFVIHQMWSGEMEEDSIIPFVPFLRRQSMVSLAHYGDSVALNGDTTNAGTGNINLDDADPADTKHYLALDGIRHACIVDNTANLKNQAGTLDYNSLLDLRKLMLDSTYLFDWGHPTDPADVVYVADPTSAEEICQLDEVKTVDQIGSRATVLAGQQAFLGQHPLISSIAMSLTEADGKVSTTAGNNTKGQVAAFNRRAFNVGWRRRVKMELERIPASDQTRLVMSLRMGLGRFSPTGAAAGIESAAVMYNITV